MNRISTFAFLFICFTCPLFSQTFSGSTGPIRDDGVQTDFIAQITSLSPETLSPVHGLKSICINLTHTWIADLDIRLIAPDGKNILLTSGLGGDTDFYMNTCFSMEGLDHIINAFPPFEGTYKPFSNIGNINDGQVGNGQWTLRILDTYAFADAGELLNWSITFDDQAPAPETFGSTTLPIFVLTTEGNVTVPNEPRVKGTIKLIDNGPGQLNHLNDAPVYDGYMAIEVRGSSSQGFPKKSFALETQTESGEDFGISLLGMPEEEDWILYAPYTDKSFMRDAITYKLGNDMGHYAPRTAFCELFLNGEYQGIYSLEEKIKRDKNRVNISKLNPADTLGDELTGGYILKVDRDDGDGTFFVSDYDGTQKGVEIRVVFDDPEGHEMHPAQKEYIQEAYDQFEDALYGPDFADPAIGYRKYIDVRSFIDYFIVSELGHNVDAYRLSSFLYKDRDSKDSLFHAGPLWDFNLAYGNADYCNCQSTEGWAYNDSGSCGPTPLWWQRLLEDPAYQDELRCRYNELREGLLSTEHVLHMLDSMSLLLNEAQQRNYVKWPILGVYVWPNNFIGSTYEEEMGYIKQWMSERLAWMDENMAGNCFASGVVDGQSSSLRIFPNPAIDKISVGFADENVEMVGTLRVTDLQGRVLVTRKISGYRVEVDLMTLQVGAYVVTFIGHDENVYREKVMVVR